MATPPGFTALVADLNSAIIREQPSDVVQFCASYFEGKLRDQRAKLLEMIGRNGGDAEALVCEMLGNDVKRSTDSDIYQDQHEESDDEAINGDNDEVKDDDEDDDDSLASSSEEEDDGDTVDEMPPMPNRARRTSVSAESMDPTTTANYAKTVIEKSAEARERIRRCVSSNFLFRSLDEEQMADVIDAMAEKCFPAGTEIIKQGGPGDYFYAVESGNLDVFVTRNGTTSKVTDYSAGGSFGELALMYNACRAATVVATSDVVLWALDRMTFRRILMENTARRRRKYESFLENVPLLEGLEPYELHKIADALDSVIYSDGEVVIRQGEVGESFYFIESGNARVSKIDEQGLVHELPSLGEGAYFGELALLNDQPRVCTITAQGRLKVATLGKKAFERLLGNVKDIMTRHGQEYKSE